MAVGQVSSVDQDNWQLIATNTPSGAASSTFSGISGYKTLMLVYKGLTPSAGGACGLRFNGDSGSNYGSNSWIVSGTQYDVSSDSIYFHYYSSAQTIYGYTIINNANSTTVPKTTESSGKWTLPVKGIWMDTSAITSIAVSNISSGTISGTIYLYGIAA